MKEQIGNIWQPHYHKQWIVIPTNGNVNANGNAVMGRGIALEAAKRYSAISHELGRLLKQGGNRVYAIPEYRIFSFPVKTHYYNKANLDLIGMSCTQLTKKVDDLGLTKVYLPRVGCGNGKLDWNREVKPILEVWLDDKFIILTLEKEL